MSEQPKTEPNEPKFPVRLETGYETGTEVISKVLVPQMGSDHTYLSQGKIDRRVFAVLNEYEQVSLAHFAYRGEVDDIRYFAFLVDWILTSSPSLGGLGRRQTIELTAAASGGAKPLEIVRKPNIVSRKLFKRDWRQKAEERGAVIVE